MFANLLKTIFTSSVEADFKASQKKMDKLIIAAEEKSSDDEILELHDVDGIAVSVAKGRKYFWGRNKEDAVTIDVGVKLRQGENILSMMTYDVT